MGIGSQELKMILNNNLISKYSRIGSFFLNGLNRFESQFLNLKRFEWIQFIAGHDLI